MNDALIGYTGFVGSSLLRQASFGGLYRSSNIGEIKGREYDRIVCAAAPAQKWIANREPEKDLQNIQALIRNLDEVRCDRFVLISTVDVFGDPRGVDEDSRVEEEGLHPYGLHRRLLERFVEERFGSHTIIRLPGLVGPGLRKNAIYDFLNGNNTEQIDSRGVFQFYPMVNLWPDIERAIESDIGLLHLASEPISIAEIVEEGFARHFDNVLDRPPPKYDLRTKYGSRYGVVGPYLYSKREEMIAIRAYAQTERPRDAMEGKP